MVLVSSKVTPFREWLKKVKHVDIDDLYDEEIESYEDEYNEKMYKFVSRED